MNNPENPHQDLDHFEDPEQIYLKSLAAIYYLEWYIRLRVGSAEFLRVKQNLEEDQDFVIQEMSEYLLEHFASRWQL